MKVRFTDHDGMCVPHTVWSLGDKVIMHSFGEHDTFSCCDKNGILVKETTSLQEAINWITEKENRKEDTV